MITKGSRFGDEAPSSHVDILVVGSINTDVTTYVDTLPEPGQTLHCNEIGLSLGGKGLNQALAASITGARVVFAGAANSSDFDSIEGATRTTPNLVLDLEPVNGATGSAWICVSNSSENFIVVNAGANHKISSTFIDRCISKYLPKIVMIQGEISSDSNMHVATSCQRLGIPLCINPSPVRQEDASIVGLSSIVVVNKTEAGWIAGADLDSPQSALSFAESMVAGGKTVIVTMGDKGSVFAGPSRSGIIRSRQPETLRDTTGAGDRFAGVLCGWLSLGKDLESALELASEAASRLCEIPHANELDFSRS